MSKQGDLMRVAIRCDVCLRGCGRPPALAEAVRDASGGWQVQVLVRAGRQDLNYRRVQIAAPHGRRILAEESGKRIIAVLVGERKRRVLVSHKGVQLDCSHSHCRHAPRESVHTLLVLAEQAVAAGRRDAYV
jgi:hypothetical protein